jgi:nicotinamidase/pyrazinamidase
LHNRWALLVVDVQRDFCTGGALPAPECDAVVEVINTHLLEAHERGIPVYASRDWHPAVTSHFKAYGGEWPPHCVQASPGAEFHPRLRLPSETVVISKGDDPDRHGYSAFEGHTSDGRSLAADLLDRHVDALSIAGIATEYCVKQTALDARRAGLRVNVLTNAIAGIEREPGDVRRAMAEMSDAGAHLGTELRPTDVAMLAVDWDSRAPLRAQLIEEGIEVVATDRWPEMRALLRPGVKPQVAFVDLKGLPDLDDAIEGLGTLMKPDRVFVLTAAATIQTETLRLRGFRLLHRPIAVAEIVSMIVAAVREPAPAA